RSEVLALVVQDAGVRVRPVLLLAVDRTVGAVDPHDVSLVVGGGLRVVACPVPARVLGETLERDDLPRRTVGTQLVARAAALNRSAIGLMDRLHRDEDDVSVRMNEGRLLEARIAEP